VQIFFDGTENRREEARKAVERQPQMSAEAKRMVTKLVVRQTETPDFLSM